MPYFTHLECSVPCGAGPYDMPPIYDPWVTTDPDEVVERVIPYATLGFTHLVFHAPGPDQRRFIDHRGQQLLVGHLVDLPATLAVYL